MNRKTLMRKCDRCGLLYPAKASQCNHCHRLTNAELDDFRAGIKQSRKQINRLGIAFLLAAGALMIGLLLI